MQITSRGVSGLRLRGSQSRHGHGAATRSIRRGRNERPQGPQDRESHELAFARAIARIAEELECQGFGPFRQGRRHANRRRQCFGQQAASRPKPSARRGPKRQNPAWRPKKSATASREARTAGDDETLDDQVPELKNVAAHGAKSKSPQQMEGAITDFTHAMSLFKGGKYADAELSFNHVTEDSIPSTSWPDRRSSTRANPIS